LWLEEAAAHGAFVQALRCATAAALVLAKADIS